jgi:hypothetical protein
METNKVLYYTPLKWRVVLLMKVSTHTIVKSRVLVALPMELFILVGAHAHALQAQ